MNRKRQIVFAAATLFAVLGVLIDPLWLSAAAFPFVLNVNADGDEGGEEDDPPGDPDPGDDDGDQDDDSGDGDGDGDDAGDDDDGQGDGDGDDDQRRSRQSRRMIPEYRFQQMQRRYERMLEAEAQRNREVLNSLRQALGGRGEEGPQLTERERRLRAEFTRLFPEFEHLMRLAPKAKDLLGLAERAPEWERDTEEFWTRVASDTSRRLYAQSAKELGVKSLDAETKLQVRDAFVAWVKADRTGERNDRYEGRDDTLIADFWKQFRQRFGASTSRRNDAELLRRAERNRGLPRGGGSSTHIPRTPKRKPRGGEDDDPFDAVNDRAWRQLQDELAGAE